MLYEVREIGATRGIEPVLNFCVCKMHTTLMLVDLSSILVTLKLIRKSAISCTDICAFYPTDSGHCDVVWV